MQTNISEQYRDSDLGQEANSILRACVHCGFCTATCPTYQLLGDELDGPRGRIYLIKQVLEGATVSVKTQLHLDRCLTCRACETTCPSGVRYGRLVDIGRELVEKQVPRTPWQSAKRVLLRQLVPFPRRFAALTRFGHLLQPVLPRSVRQKIPAKQNRLDWPQRKHARRMLVLQGCAQSVSTPRTNAAAARVLDKLGIELRYAPSAGCCGAVSHHLAAPDEALDFMRRNIDAWWPYVEQSTEAIVSTASGCGVLLKDYGALLKHDPDYAEKAQRVSALARDISEVVNQEDIAQLKLKSNQRSVAFHSPCTLQHGMQLNGVVEAILTKAGFKLVEVQDTHLCCGSAGTYSILQPKLSQKLLRNKLTALEENEPAVIATANIGCQLHLASKAQRPVYHWIELLSDSLN
jgi:glycolate oxidase iron-sulfur subunit